MRGLTAVPSARSDETSWRREVYGEATYRHNHPDLPRLAQIVRETARSAEVLFEQPRGPDALDEVGRVSLSRPS